MNSEDEPKVEYRDVPGYPGYRVGSDGTVWSRLKRVGLRREHGKGRGFAVVLGTEWKKLKPSVPKNKRSYPHLELGQSPNNKNINVHALVMLCFVGPRPDGMEVAHENGNHLDARLSNLSYKTPSENQMDRARHGTDNSGENSWHTKLTNEAVKAIRSEWAANKTTFTALARKHGVSRYAVSRVIRGKSWKRVGG